MKCRHFIGCAGLFAVALPSVAPAATDATWAADGAWTAAATWAEGVPPSGAGATLWVTGKSKNSSLPTYMSHVSSTRTNATIGHISWKTDDKTPGTLGLCAIYQAELVQDGGSLPHYRDYTVSTPWALTLDSGSTSASSPATIGSTRDRANAPYTQSFWIDLPLILKSHLRLQHTGRESSGKGLYIGGYSGERAHVSIAVNSDISDGGRKLGIEVNVPTYAYNGSSVTKVYNTAMLTGRNSFSGDVTVKEGILRVDSRDGRYSDVSTALGIGNSVYVQSNLAALNLSGVRTGEGQHLYLGSAPLPTTGSTATMGGLCNMYRDPFRTAEWLGQVTLTADSTVGGCIGFEPQNTSGAIEISGPIDGKFALRKINEGYLTLSGANTFTGNLRLEGGYTMLASTASAGNGKIIFAGGGYRMTSADDVDISTCRLGVGEHPVQLFLDGDFTYEPAYGFTNQWGIYKTGPGRLVLSKPCKWCGYANNPTAAPKQRINNFIAVEDGELVMDYANLGASEHILDFNAPVTDGGVDNGGLLASSDIRLANDAKVTIRVPVGRQVDEYAATPCNNTCATLRKEGGGVLQVARLATCIGDKPAVIHLDVAEGEVVTYDNNKKDRGITDSELPCILHRGLLWKNESFAINDGSDRLSKFTDFATAWGENCKTQILSVTSALAASVPAHFNVGALYLNTPPTSGNVLELKLTGTNIVSSGVIFVGPDMGETIVRISGGAIAINPSTAKNNRAIRLYNFNTNANARLEITSELSCDSFAFDAEGTARVTSTNDNGRLIVVGGGVTRFTGKNTIRGDMHVLGGNLEINTADYLEHEAEAGYYLFKYHYVTAGGRLAFLKPGLYTQWHRNYKSQRGVDPRGGAWSSPQFHILRPCGILDVPNADHIVGLTNVTQGLYIHAGATLVKKGAGGLEFDEEYARRSTASVSYQVGTTGSTVYLAHDPVSRWDVQEGAIVLPSNDTSKNNTRGMAAFGTDPTVVRLRPGVRLLGKGFLCGNMAYGGNHYTAVDVTNPIRYIVEPNEGAPVIVDCARKCWSGIAMGEFDNDYNNYLGPRAAGLFSGSGDIRVVNSGTEERSLNPQGFVCEEYTGTISMEINMSGTDGLMFPNGGVAFKALSTTVNDGYHHYFYSLAAPVKTFEIGRLSGDGKLSLNFLNWMNADTGCYVGCNDGSTNVFTGSIAFGRSSNRNTELVKVGTSIQEFTGQTSDCQSPIYVAEGTFRVGTDCSTGLTSPIPSEYASVYLGCGTDAAGENPRLTTSGPYGIVAPIYAWAEGTTSPEIGSDALEGTSVYKTGEISIQNRVAFTAAGASTVIISNNLVGTGILSKRGTGTVILAGSRAETLTLGDLEAGNLTVTGDVVIEEGSVLDLTTLDYSSDALKYELLSSDGTISGFENYTVVGKPKNWSIQNWNGRYVLVRKTGLQILFWGQPK